ncbi:MAG: PHP domain-containing protein [Candidatus Sifarchaeia archaeon]
MDMFTFDLHMHTHYSFDSLIRPEKLFKRAEKIGLNAIAITDHNTIRGSLKAVEYAKDSNIIVVKGAEINTDLGDVIGLFLTEDIKSRIFHDVITEIRDQNGLVYLPHPYSSSTKLNQMDISKFDAIEVINGRKPQWQNKKAAELVGTLDTIGLGGSDTHIMFELGCIYNIAETPIDTEDSLREVIQRGKSRIFQDPFFSQRPLIVRANHYISWIRAKQYRKFVDRGASMIRRVIPKMVSYN